MAVNFTFTPPTGASRNYGGSRKSKPKVLMAEFGDGYAQRAADGQNNQPRMREISWTNLTKTEMQTIINFFEARGGVEAFYYQEPDELTNRVYICTEWDFTDSDFNAYDVTASFQQVYDL